MGVWRTPSDEEYKDPEGLIGRKVRVYFDGDCTYFEAQVIHTSFTFVTPDEEIVFVITLLRIAPCL